MKRAGPGWPRRILVVDDAPLVLDLFRDLLSHAGFEVDIAQSATAAMACLVTRHYALVVADCVLSDLPVLDWLAALHGAVDQTPLILCSGEVGRTELLAYAAKFHAVAVLEKPFSMAELVTTVRRVIP